MDTSIITGICMLLGVVMGVNIQLRGWIYGLFSVICILVLIRIPELYFQPIAKHMYPYTSTTNAHLAVIVFLIVLLGAGFFFIGRVIVEAVEDSIPERINRALGVVLGMVAGYFFSLWFQGRI